MKKVGRYSKDRTRLYNLYTQAFPPIERLPIRTMMSYVGKPGVEVWNFYKGDVYAGFAYMLLSGRYTYLLFCATPEELRGQGLGAAIIRKLTEHYQGRTMVLDIEVPDASAANAEQRMRRLHFYERLSFALSSYEMTDETGDYAILTANAESLDVDAFREMFRILPPIFEGTVIVPAKPQRCIVD